MTEEKKHLTSNGHHPNIFESKEEPLDDISLADDNEISNQSASLLKEPKKEPLDFFSSFIENEISQQYSMEENEWKKEDFNEHDEYNRPPSPFLLKDEQDDEYTQDLVRLGLIPPWEAEIDHLARYNMSQEVKEEPVDVKEEIDSDAEPQEFMDDFKDELMLMENDALSDSEPPMKKSRANDGKPSANNVLQEEDVQPNTMKKKLPRMKNDIKLDCPACKYTSKFVGLWIRHLKTKHSTSMLKANLLLRCRCGNESLAEKHIRECNSTNDCVVRVVAMKKNETELECPKCKFRTHFVVSLLDHLDIKHSSSLELENISLLCKCGNESISNDHGETCKIANFTVFRREQDDMEVTSTPQCIQCEKHPSTAHSYAQHLSSVHKSTLIASGIYLVCSCGAVVRSSTRDSNHPKENCAGCEFTLHKLDKKGHSWNQGSVQCVLCEKFPTTAYGYAIHLQRAHKSSLIANGIYLRCSCGVDVRSKWRSANHNEECDCCEFTLHKIEERVHSNPQCILCEAYPSSAYAYAAHLKTNHKTTLISSGIYLKCSCGFDIRHDYRSPNHYKQCDGRAFTLHKLNENNFEYFPPPPT